MAVLTNFLKLLKPEKNDYVDVDKHISENYDKIDNKMQELNTSNSGKLDKGALPTTIKSGKDLYDMLENNGGINIDTALLYLNDTGTKTAGKVYFDKNKKGLFECIKTTTNTVNSTEFFVDISNKASADRLTNLGHYISHDNVNKNFSLNDLKIMCGISREIADGGTIRFPKSFTALPIVLVNTDLMVGFSQNANITTCINAIRADSFKVAHNYGAPQTIYWIAIGY